MVNKVVLRILSTIVFMSLPILAIYCVYLMCCFVSILFNYVTVAGAGYNILEVLITFVRVLTTSAVLYGCEIFTLRVWGK